MANCSWKEAIEQVLREDGSPLHEKYITEQIISRGLRDATATPARTVNRTLNESINNEGERSPFIRHGPHGDGVYALRNAKPDITHADDELLDAKPGVAPTENRDSIIRAFGVYWRRDFVVWAGNPKLYGRQTPSSDPIDFGGQKGTYILYDDHTAVYVGQVARRGLGQRLFDHTKGRIFGRWNRFSWFGLLEPTDEGVLKEASFGDPVKTIIDSMEALLIEALEPPQNRQAGRGVSDIEYHQAIDPQLKCGSGGTRESCS